jgi:hypothetical protein
MKMTDENGLAVLVAEPNDVPRQVWLSHGGRADLVTVQEPAEESLVDLQAAGFIHKPAAITWLAPLCASEEAFLRRARRTTRAEIRKARDAVDGMQLLVRHGPAAQELDEFLSLYTRQLGAMRNGIPHAVRKRTEILDNPKRFFAILARAGTALAGGCICEVYPQWSAIRLRYSGVDESWRDGLSRVLYCAAMQVGRDASMEWVTLGNDTNLYGNTVQPSLLRFKTTFGFDPVPSQDFHDLAGYDRADRVLSLAHLADPTVVLGYATGRLLRPYVITSKPNTDAGRFRGIGAAEPVVVTL